MHQHSSELRGSEILGIGYEIEMRITNYELPISILFVFFAGTDITARSGNCSAFQAGEYSGVIVRRSQTYGYGGCCLSGKVEKSEKRKVERGGLRLENGGWRAKKL